MWGFRLYPANHKDSRGSVLFDRLIECDIQEPVITVNREVAFEVGLFTQVSDETFHETGIYVFKQALRHIVSKMIGQTS